MRILLITTYFAPDSGAAAVRLSRLAKQLVERGHQVTVLTTMPHYPHGKIAEAYRGKFTVTEIVDGVKVVRAWLYATPSTKISRRLISQMSFMFTAFWRGLFTQLPDVILIEAQPMFTNFAGVVLSWLKRVPYVQNVSDLWPDHLLSVGKITESNLLYRLARTVTDATYRHAKQIIAMSPAWAEAIQRYIGQTDKIQVIYNGIDLARFAPGDAAGAADFRRKYKLDERQIVAFIGTFTTQNDFATMLAVVRRLRHRADLQFVFVGKGAQEDLLKTALDAVTWIGWVDYADIPQVWAATHIMLLALRDHPLYAGTVPAKYFEVMACGVPIAAAVQGIAAEMVQTSGAGIVMPCGDVEGLAHAIECLLDDETLYVQMSAAGRAYAEANFDIHKVIDAYEAVLIKARG